MAIRCTATISLAYAGDRSQNYSFPGASNPNSPDAETYQNLATGDNTVNIPTVGVTAQGVVMIPPEDNQVVLKFKGAGGDTGIQTNRNNPTQLGLDSGVASFIVNAAAPVVGVRFRIY